jgi:hypothetical protein
MIRRLIIGVLAGAIVGGCCQLLVRMWTTQGDAVPILGLALGAASGALPDVCQWKWDAVSVPVLAVLGLVTGAWAGIITSYFYGRLMGAGAINEKFRGQAELDYRERAFLALVPVGAVVGGALGAVINLLRSKRRNSVGEAPRVHGAGGDEEGS